MAQQIHSLRNLGVSVDVLHVRRDQEGRRAYRNLPAQLIAAGAVNGARLIHVMYGGVMAERVTRTAQGPTVVSFCGSDLNGVPQGSPAERLSAWFGVRSSHRAARRATAIVVKSKGLAEALPADVDRQNVWIIPNGVDVNLFRPLDRSECQAKLGWEPGRCHILFYARGPGKRPELAREAVSLANGQGIEVELHEMEHVAYSDVPIWMNGADALLCTSIKEGSPNTVKEALACGLPVVSVDAGDVAERITGAEGCRLVTADAPSIAEAIREVGAENRRVDSSVVADLSLDRVARRVIEVYEFAMGTVGPQRRPHIEAGTR